ncbi:MAG: acetyl-CoA carboxylase biotin carboxyl carrier protein [Chitinophagales bacterium]
MDFKEIQELIRMVNKNNIAELTIENQDFRIKIKTALAGSGNFQTQIMPPVQQQVMPQLQQTTQVENQVQHNKEETKTESTSGNNITIKSPIVGTFYRSPGPDKDVFVKVGDEISVGTKLCIIEAMKLFNEIESEVAGKIVKILADDASPVEYDQPLFLIEPK